MASIAFFCWRLKHRNGPQSSRLRVWCPKNSPTIKDIWLVVWNMFYFPIYWEFHHPNWLSYFSEGWPNHQADMENLLWYLMRIPPWIGGFPHGFSIHLFQQKLHQVGCELTAVIPSSESEPGPFARGAHPIGIPVGVIDHSVVSLYVQLRVYIYIYTAYIFVVIVWLDGLYVWMIYIYIYGWYRHII